MWYFPQAYLFSQPQIFCRAVVRSQSFFFFFLIIYWLCWVFVAAQDFLVAASEDKSLVVVQGLLIAVTSLVEHGLQALRLQQLWSLGSVVGSFLALEHRRSRCGTRACMWVPTQPGIEPVSSAMAGGFITTQATREAPAPVLGTEWTRGSRLTGLHSGFVPCWSTVGHCIYLGTMV